MFAPLPLCLTSLVLVGAAWPARAQTLPWSIETTTVTPASAHGGHERPIGFLQLTQDQHVSARVRHLIHIPFDVTLTNSAAGPAIGSVRILTWSPELIGCGSAMCWGYDGAPDHRDLASVQLAPNEVRRIVGVHEYPAQMTFATHPASPVAVCASDCLHVPTGGLSYIALAPSSASPPSFYQTGGTGQVTVTTAYLYFEHEVVVRSDYNLPPLGAGTGCGSSNPNSTGAIGTLEAFGVSGVDHLIVLSSQHLPVGALGYYLVSSLGQAPAPMGGGLGSLCLGQPIARWFASVGPVTPAGSLERAVPNGTTIGPVTITPGSTWHFQLWHRDSVAGSATSNTTNSVAVTF